MDLLRARDLLDNITHQLLLKLKERQDIIHEVAAQKALRGDGVIHVPAREAAMFHKAVCLAQQIGVDPDYAIEVLSLIVAHSKDVECQEMGVETFFDRRPRPREELLRNLVKLTDATAADYDLVYCDGDGTDAIRSYLRHERTRLQETIDQLPTRGLALDLGCATGGVAEVLERHFGAVEAVDVSEPMVARARTRRKWPTHASFRVADLESGIPAKSASVSLAVANFGAASEVSTGLLSELGRVLAVGGKAFLSFYNQDAVSNLWYYPWPSTLRAHLNVHNDTLEVWYKDQVYVIHAVARTIKQVQSEAVSAGLKVEFLESYPTVLPILPRFFFTSGRARRLVETVTRIDMSLASGGPRVGTYLIACLAK